MKDLPSVFGRRVRGLRKAKEMTLEDLGRSAGIGYKHISEIERGVKVPSFEAIGRIARALHAQPYELFLPEHLAAHPADRNVRLLIQELVRHGTPAMKQFLARVLTAARDLEAERRT